MSDFSSSLPVRTENAGDVIAKIADATIPSQQLTVEADGSINVNASFAPGAEVIITDGTDDLAINADGSINSVVTATNLDIRDLVFATDKVDVSGSSVTVSATDLDIRDLSSATDSVTVLATDLDIRDLNSATDSVTVLATDLDIRNLVFATDKVDVSGSSVTVSATDLDIRDLNSATDSVTVLATNLDIRDLTHVSDSIRIGDGTDFLAVNADGSINVVPQEDPGTERVNYDTSAAIAAGASDNHDFLFTNGGRLYQVLASASGKLKAEVQIETGSSTNVFNTVAVRFNSTATPDCDMTLSKYAVIPTGARVRVIRTNRDTQAQDVYSTIVGIEN